MIVLSRIGELMNRGILLRQERQEAKSAKKEKEAGVQKTMSPALLRLLFAVPRYVAFPFLSFLLGVLGFLASWR